MPAMHDPYFAKSVTYICEHNSSGALGVVVNQPIAMDLEALFAQLNLNISELPLARKPAQFGGPVQVERGFVLHQPKGDWDCTIAINDEVALTSSKDILEAAAVGDGPEKMLVTLGYAGWSAGQLEAEISQNAWLTVKATDSIIFDLPNEQKLNAAMGLLGLNFANLSEVAGHA